MKQRLLFILGIASALGVEIFAKGMWSHFVWAPVLVLLFTDIEGVVGTKDVAASLSQRVKFLVGVGGTVAVELLAQGKWAHAVWVPAAIMLVTDLEKVLGGTTAPPAPAPAAPAAAVEVSKDETVTPIDKPKPPK